MAGAANAEWEQNVVEHSPESAKEIGIGPYVNTNDGIDSNVKSEVGTSSTHPNESVRVNEVTAEARAEVTVCARDLRPSQGSTADFSVSGTKAQATQSSSTSTTKSVPFESRFSGEYTEQRVIGRGRFGVVFKARHTLDKQLYAIKQVDMTRTERPIKKVMREVHFLASLKHPNITQYYDAWLEEQPPGGKHPWMDNNQPCLYIRMELCSGPTLHEWLRQNRLPEQRPISQTLDWFHQLISVVKYIHDKGLIHRDIKPENIFFGSSHGGAVPVLKIGDLGLAIDVALASSFGVSGDVNESLSIVGTVMYMSPEQPSGHYTNSTDIFSLGLVFLEMVYPFKTGMKRFDIFGALRSKQRPAVMDELDKEVGALISWMTAFEPEKRATASELDNELKKMTEEQLSEPTKEIGVEPHAETNNSTDSNIKSEVGTSSTHLNGNTK